MVLLGRMRGNEEGDFFCEIPQIGCLIRLCVLSPDQQNFNQEKQENASVLGKSQGNILISNESDGKNRTALLVFYTYLRGHRGRLCGCSGAGAINIHSSWSSSP